VNPTESMAKSGTTEDKSAFRFDVVKISFVWILTTAGASVALKRKRATMGGQLYNM